jgi:hypothetical protein
MSRGVVVMSSKGNWMADPAKGRDQWQRVLRAHEGCCGARTGCPRCRGLPQKTFPSRSAADRRHAALSSQCANPLTLSSW